ncbi:MAG: DUF2254 domain-containing protein [Gemmatimonadales bacterium]
MPWIGADPQPARAVRPAAAAVRLWSRLRSSLWFVPGLIVLGAATLAILLIDLGGPIGGEVAARWPRIFGAGADGSRGMLTAIATSMITVAGVVFSITIVALSLAASQYSSRILRNFLTDRTNQAVLGVFVGIFGYCLIVLRTIRGGTEGKFVPPLAVLGGVVLAFVGIGVLVYFIHHIATAIQASHILAAASAETIRTVERVFAEPLAEGETEGTTPGPPSGGARQVLSANRSGYLQTVDEAGLLRLARERGIVIRMERGVGEFVIEDAPLMSLDVPGAIDPKLADRLRGLAPIGRQRTLDQDVSYGIRQLVDVALKALSPGVNDTTTAVMCLNYLTAVTARVTRRRLPPADRFDGVTLRLTLHVPSYAALVGEAFEQIRHQSEGNAAILSRLLWSLETLTEVASTAGRREVLRGEAIATRESILRSTIPHEARRELELRADRLLVLLATVA